MRADGGKNAPDLPVPPEEDEGDKAAPAPAAGGGGENPWGEEEQAAPAAKPAAKKADAGDVWGPDDRIRGTDVRVATGVAVSWDSPVGPLRFSFGNPIKKRPGDRVERFQFQLGKIF